jgi:hypothetical protein
MECGRQQLVLRLDEVLKEPELGSPELPTVGSAAHRFGNCKPCAFVHTKGCENGVECPYCHICRPGEKKRRQRDKLERRRELLRWQESMATATAVGGVQPAAPLSTASVTPAAACVLSSAATAIAVTVVDVVPPAAAAACAVSPPWL